MSQDNSAIEVKVGALVLVSLALLAGFVFVLGDISFASGKRFQIEFDNAGGLKPGADLAVAGLNVGQVESLEFVKDDASSDDPPAVTVVATVRVAEAHEESIREGSDFFISTRSVLGEKYIEVVTPTLDTPSIEAGARVEGVSPPRVDLMISKTSELLDGFIDLLQDPDVSVDEFFRHTASLVRHVDELIVDNRDDLDATVTNARRATGKAVALLAALEYSLGDEKKLESTYDDFRATLSNARSISGSLRGDVDPIVENFKEASGDAREVSRMSRELVEQNKPKLAESLDNVQKTSRNVRELSGNADRIVASVEKGEGTVGQLLRDREMYDDLRELLRILKRHPWKIMWKE